MKLFLSLVFVLMCSSSYGSGTYQTVRVMDGLNAVCFEVADVGSLSQRVTLTETKEAGDKSVLTLKIEFFECVQKSDIFFLKSAALSSANIKITDPLFLLVAKESQIIFAQKLDVNSAVQEVTLTLPTKLLIGLDAFVRVLVDRGGNGYESFGPLRILNQ